MPKLLWRGPSVLDGKPLVVLAPSDPRSRNAKTGGMLQTYILREDIHPSFAVQNGEDFSICGDCRHRGNGLGSHRSCYVQVQNGPASLWKAYDRRRDLLAPMTESELLELGTEHLVRLGAYGDPAAAPPELWATLLQNAKGWTGYTHQWRTAPGLQQWCMASADSDEEARVAQALGWRTFRVKNDTDPATADEITCPASAEAGHKVQCAQCLACGGNNERNSSQIVINVHGVEWKKRAFAA